MAYEVYILWSPTGRCFYIGVSADAQLRFIQHNNGISKWTSRFAGSWELVWKKTCASLGEARILDNELKRQKGGDGFFARTGLTRENFRTSGP